MKQDRKLQENEEMVDVLEDKTVHDYISKYYKLQTKIGDMLSKLKNCGCRCDCDECSEFIINADNIDKSQRVCIECGGYIEW